MGLKISGESPKAATNKSTQIHLLGVHLPSKMKRDDHDPCMVGVPAWESML
jgi:hypothetical protein